MMPSEDHLFNEHIDAVARAEIGLEAATRADRATHQALKEAQHIWRCAQDDLDRQIGSRVKEIKGRRSGLAMTPDAEARR